MAKYVYPAVFEKDGDSYAVSFPDLEGCFTCGDDMSDALAMAEDALNLWLWEAEESGDAIPEPTPLKEIKTDNNSVASLVRADTLAYRKTVKKKAVKKTLTIPGWMDEIAKENNINFSQVLQDALTEKLHLA